MGSSFLTVNERSEKYLEDAEWTYRGLEEGVRTRLVNLAIIARNSMENVWPRQLDKSEGCG